MKKHGKPGMGSENPSASIESSISIEIPSLNLENKLMVEKLAGIAFKIRNELEEVRILLLCYKNKIYHSQLLLCCNTLTYILVIF